ncbi:YfhO family protein [Lysobacter gummosus]|uniref:YfhO family protein n=1 Tax=Lysobacter gummosus TaxID=262324 RepID=A0ABY3XDA3_9GAMM|nr:YfhO family protein [Lysobacter gummosus]ALN93117.1 bacterial membrane YfhO family protein [Lysobacter gummosus]UNP28626.1 YfhO family protein [Lysobacter gummosus]
MTVGSAEGRARLSRSQLLTWWLALAAVFVGFYVAYFSPVLFGGSVLGPGDGIVYYLAFFDLPIGRVWNSMILSGYPVVTDIQAQSLYLLRWISPDFNTLVLSAYVVSALGMFGLSLKLTGSRIGAFFAAIVVSGSGFMTGHLGHLSIIHVAAWIPFILWAIACLRGMRSVWPVIAGAMAVALSVYAGHPQVSIIGLLLSGCYGLHEIGYVARTRGAGEAWAMLLRVFALFALGLMLAAPALLPVTQAVSDGVRSGWTIEDFGSYSLTPGTLRLLAFPNLYGTYAPSPFGGYSGLWNLTEIAIYVGILPGLLGLAALLGWRRDRSQWFWAAAAVVGLLLSLGISTPLGHWVYELPVLGKFRAQGRFGLVTIIALGVLSAYGFSALLRAPLPRRRLYALAGASLVLLSIAIASVALDPTPPHGLADAADARLWPRPAFWSALLFMGLSLIGLLALALKRSRFVAVACVLLVAVDLGSFGWFEQWRYFASPKMEQRDLSRKAAQVVERLAQGDGRLLPVDSAEMPYHPLRPNINVRFRIPSVVGYGPLMSARYSQYTRADSVGRFPITDPNAPIMDVLAIRWIAGEGGTLAPELLGSGCGAPTPIRRKVRAVVPQGARVSAIRVISNSACSATISTGTTLARMRLFDADGANAGEYTIDVGEETAEWAYDRPDVAATIKHTRPAVFETYPAGDFQGLWFQADLPVRTQAGTKPPRTIEVEMEAIEGATLRVRTLALVEDEGAQPRPLRIDADAEASARALTRRWQVEGLPVVSERNGYRGMVWGVCSARVATPDQIAEALGSRQLGDGRKFDPFAEALLEHEDGRARTDCRSAPQVTVLDKHDGYWKLRVSGDGAALAMISESYHRDWRARVDGKKAPVFAADGLIMAVPVPTGEHTLELTYTPKRYRIGLLIALIAIAGCLLLALGAWRKSARGRSTQ